MSFHSAVYFSTFSCNAGRGVILTFGCGRVNEEVIIRLKWGQTEYKGRLVSIDSYMNIQLSGAEEWIDQEMTSVLGQVLIRYALNEGVERGRLEPRCCRSRDGHRLIVSTGAITSYGFKAQTRTTAIRTRRWRDDDEITEMDSIKQEIHARVCGGILRSRLRIR
jgi:small nuclear ribonucleoprotein (snRNP)-like protein